MSLPQRTFGRHLRILQGRDFDRIFRTGRRGFVAGLRVVVTPSEFPHSRLGMAVSRRFGPAVVRNRARRLLREAFRQCHAQFDPPVDIVVLPLPEGFPDSPPAVEELLRRAVQHALNPRPRKRRKGPTP